MADITVFGIGSLGSQTATVLTRMGQNIVALIDDDVVEEKNLTKAAYGMTDIGRLKVEALRDRLLDINKNLTIKTYNKKTQELSEDDFKDIFESSQIILHTADSKSSLVKLVQEMTRNYQETRKEVYLVTMYCFDNASAGITGLWTPAKNEEMLCPCCLLQQMLGISTADNRVTDNDPANDYSMDRLIGFNVRGLLPDVLYGVSLTTALIQAISVHIEGIEITGRDNLLARFLYSKEKKNNQLWSPFRDPCLVWQSPEIMGTFTGLGIADEITCFWCGRNMPVNQELLNRKDAIDTYIEAHFAYHGVTEELITTT